MRLVGLIVPEHCGERAGADAMTATGAFCGVEYYSAAFFRSESISGADFRAGRNLAPTADDNHKTLRHAAGRFYGYASFSEAAFVLKSHTCEHTALASHTFISIYDGEPHNLESKKLKGKSQLAEIKILSKKAK